MKYNTVSVLKGAIWLAVLLNMFLLWKFEPVFSASNRNEEAVDWTAMVDFSLDKFPLIDFLAFQSRTNNFSFLLDRRIDPSTLITFSSEPVPLIEGITQALATVSLEPLMAGDMLYIGPKDAAGFLLLDKALRKQTEKFSKNKNKGQLEKSVRIDCPEGGIPSELLTDMAKEIKFSWNKLQLMPFDCWREVHSGPIPAGDAISLLLIGFNVTWQPDAEKPILTPVAFELDKPVSRTYSPKAAPIFDRLDKSRFPNVEISDVAGSIHASGTFADVAKLEYAVEQERIHQILESRRAEQENNPDFDASQRERVISGEIQQGSISSIFKQFQSLLGMKGVLDPSVQARGISLETRVSCRFDAADKRKAAEILADALGVSVRLSGNEALFYVNER